MSQMTWCETQWIKQGWMPVRSCHRPWVINPNPRFALFEQKDATMARAFPFVRFINLSNGADALLGFALPFLPDMLTSRWLSSPNAHKRLEEALQLQVHLINAFWNMRITAWDLRFVGTDELPGVTIGLICRIRRPAKVDPRQFQNYCLDLAKQAQQLFGDYGYELSPLTDEISLTRYLTPFQFQAVGEVRKAEKL